METVEILQRQLRAAEELYDLVRTMKVLAAVNMRHLERAVEALADYTRTIELGLHVVLRTMTVLPVSTFRSAHGLAAIVFGSDQGMCGPLNDRVASYVDQYLKKSSSSTESLHCVAVGERVAARLADAGYRIDTTLSTPSSVSGITARVQDLLVVIDRWYSRGLIQRVMVFYAEHSSHAAYQPVGLTLLPVDQEWLQEIRSRSWDTHVLPMHTLDADFLFSQLIRHYLFTVLFRGCAESMASENASRLAAMRAAERNIGDRITALRTLYHQSRQMAITEELLDIASGFEALTSTESRAT